MKKALVARSSLDCWPLGSRADCHVTAAATPMPMAENPKPKTRYHEAKSSARSKSTCSGFGSGSRPGLGFGAGFGRGPGPGPRVAFGFGFRSGRGLGLGFGQLEEHHERQDTHDELTNEIDEPGEHHLGYVWLQPGYIGCSLGGSRRQTD